MEEVPASERVAKIQKRQCEVPGVRWRASREGSVLRLMVIERREGVRLLAPRRVSRGGISDNNRGGAYERDK